MSNTDEKFRWVKSIGRAIIDEVTLEIGDEPISCEYNCKKCHKQCTIYSGSIFIKPEDRDNLCKPCYDKKLEILLLSK